MQPMPQEETLRGFPRVLRSRCVSGVAVFGGVVTIMARRRLRALRQAAPLDRRKLQEIPAEYCEQIPEQALGTASGLLDSDIRLMELLRCHHRDLVDEKGDRGPPFLSMLLENAAREFAGRLCHVCPGQLAKCVHRITAE